MHESLRSMSRDFVSIKVQQQQIDLSSELQEQDEETELEVEATLAPERREKKLIKPEEMAHVEIFTVPERTFGISVHNPIMDTITETMD